MSEINDCEDTCAGIRKRLTAAIVRRIGLTAKIAAPLAEEVIEALRDISPGRELYIPARDKENRNAAIRKKFNGRNRDEVCREYGIGTAQLYRIVKEGAE